MNIHAENCHIKVNGDIFQIYTDKFQISVCPLIKIDVYLRQSKGINTHKNTHVLMVEMQKGCLEMLCDELEVVRDNTQNKAIVYIDVSKIQKPVEQEEQDDEEFEECCRCKVKYPKKFMIYCDCFDDFVCARCCYTCKNGCSPADIVIVLEQLYSVIDKRKIKEEQDDDDDDFSDDEEDSVITTEKGR